MPQAPRTPAIITKVLGTDESVVIFFCISFNFTQKYWSFAGNVIVREEFLRVEALTFD